MKDVTGGLLPHKSNSQIKKNIYIYLNNEQPNVSTSLALSVYLPSVLFLSKKLKHRILKLKHPIKKFPKALLSSKS